MNRFKQLLSSLLVIVLLTNCSREYSVASNDVGSWDTMYYEGYDESSPIRVYTMSLSDKIK